MIEMIDSLDEDFKIRFSDFCSYAAKIHVLEYLENPFSIEVSDAQENLQPELIYMHYDSVFVTVPTRNL
jgi:hypothetical protein